MREEKLRVKTNIEIAPMVYRMVLEITVYGKTFGAGGAAKEELRPGQFVELQLEGRYLRRPISICDASENELTLVYKTVGKGTEQMSLIEEGEIIHVLLPLGNGYDLDLAGESPLLIGGGVGVPPLYYLAKELVRKGITPKVILGFNKASEVFLTEEFLSLGCEVILTTVDGSEYPYEYLGGLAQTEGFSHGNNKKTEGFPTNDGAKDEKMIFTTGKIKQIKGFPTDAMKEIEYSYVYTCGPLPMLKAVFAQLNLDGKSGQFSLEERMGCGFGACMGCSIEVFDVSGKNIEDLSKGNYSAEGTEMDSDITPAVSCAMVSKRVCKDGPVFRKEELPW